MMAGILPKSAVAVAIMLMTLLVYWASLPPLDYARFEQRSTVVESRDGAVMHVHLSRDDKYRLLTRMSDVSPIYLQSLLAVEDQRFFEHLGVDPLALFRAAWQWLSTGDIVSGGSTITMQVARLLEPKPRTLDSKLTEMLRALELEWRHSKSEILTMYLTMVPMGSNVEGIRAGTFWIWGSNPQHLSLSQTAALLSIPQAPTARSPFRNTQNLIKAQHRVASTLIQKGIFTATDLDELSLTENIEHPVPFPKYAWHASQRFKASTDRVTTTIDPIIQTDLESIAARHGRALADDVNLSALVVDASNGEIVAYLGSLGIDSISGFIDYTQAPRSPGSTLKPFVYGMAFDDHLLRPDSVMLDVATSFAGYRPTNFDQTHWGAIRAGDALSRSLNVPAVNVLNDLGPDAFVSAWQHAQLTLGLDDPTSPVLGLVLGACTTSLKDLVTAYTAIAWDGTVIHPTLLPRSPPFNRRFLITESTAVTLRSILANVRNNRQGTLNSDWRPQPTAFKTGTSVGFRDSWTLGNKGKYVIGVWVGTPTGGANQSNTGRNRALKVASAIADTLPETADIIPWTSTPITPGEIPHQPPKVIYPGDGSRLVLLQTPSSSRQIPLTTSGDPQNISIYLNDQKIEMSQNMVIPIPHDGFYDLEIRRGAVSVDHVSFAVLTGG